MTHQMPFVPDPRSGQRGKWTMYRGLVYQSHLEAAFAETLDHARPEPWTHEYHPIVHGTTYPPDFLIANHIYVELKTALYEPEQPTLWDHESEILDEGEWRRRVEHQMERMETVWSEQPEAMLMLIEQRPAGPIPTAEALLIGLPGWEDHPRTWWWAHLPESRQPRPYELIEPWDVQPSSQIVDHDEYYRRLHEWGVSDQEIAERGPLPPETTVVASEGLLIPYIHYAGAAAALAREVDDTRKFHRRHFAENRTGSKPFWPLPWRDRGHIAALGYRVH